MNEKTKASIQILEAEHKFIKNEMHKRQWSRAKVIEYFFKMGLAKYKKNNRMK